MALADDQMEGEGYRWESGYEKTWEVIEEDTQGCLDSAVQSIIEKSKRKRLEERRAAGHVCLGIMRHVYIILDQSQAMLDQDLRPNRILATVKILEKFIEEFFDSNPMSQVGWIACKNKKAERLGDMSGNLRKHLEVLKTIVEKNACSGELSLQNALEMALASLKHMPTHTSREIIIIHGSLSTCDPGDINSTVKDLKKCGVRCSVISLAAEIHACKMMTTQTGGTFGVMLDESHFRDLVNEHIEPPPMYDTKDTALIKMGFPQRNQSEFSAMCLCHIDVQSENRPSTGGYLCPQCKAKYCELPAECRDCGLTLVSAPHLARSFLHIFPLDSFEELPAVESVCFGCNKNLPDKNKHIYRCKQCKLVFCLDCDLFLHETLHNCPGCSQAPSIHIARRAATSTS